MSLYAALDVKTGQVQGKTAGRHTSAEFVAFLEGLGIGTSRAKQIHVDCRQSLGAQNQDVEHFLQQHPKVHLHFTPTYSSWLNQVELWFAKIQRDVIRRGVFTSVADLGRNPTRRITPSSAVTVH